jgi:cysteine desulfurase
VSGTRTYLDHAATTPLLPEARAAMADALARWHNPNSPHAEGRQARASLEEARVRIGAALGWTGKIIFTSGASEALTIALTRTKCSGIYLSAVEHDSLLRAAPGALRIPVGIDGIVSSACVEGERPLVAIQHANSETGVVQPLEDLAAAVHERGGILLADCAQSAGKLALPDADLIALSAHKFGGPPGVGALLVKDFGLIEPVGGQEQGYRYGTENLPGILAMVAALEAERDWMGVATMLRRRLDDAILESGGEIVARDAPRIATIASYRMPGVASAAQLIQFDMAGIAVSAGSACSSGSLKTSRILQAMAWPEDAAGEIVRVSFGRESSDKDVDRFLSTWRDIARRRRAA